MQACDLTADAVFASHGACVAERPCELTVIRASRAARHRGGDFGVMLCVPCCAGQHWFRSGRLQHGLRGEAHTVDLFAAGCRHGDGGWKGEAGELTTLRLSLAAVTRPMQADPASSKRWTRRDVFDDRAATLALELADQTAGNWPLGRLYAQGLALALIGYLSACPAESVEREEPATGLSSARRECVLDFIAAHLHAGMSVERLATHVRMSPFRFARAFKASMGISPHRYVQQRRVEAAAHALRLTSAPPIVEIALAHGFSSQAHFTDVFRRHTGTTPARFRCMQAATADSR